MIDHLSASHSGTDRQPWNKGKLIGVKLPLRPKALSESVLHIAQTLLQAAIECGFLLAGVEQAPARLLAEMDRVM